ncbi:hypothetical protein GSQ04_004381 [Salmonella enterica]|nr:hypothetical protein [Salmonella enterica subsp. enterica serovar Kentucky]
MYDAMLTWIFRVLILLSPLSGFQPPSSVEFRGRGFDVLRGPAVCSLRYSPSPV